MFKENFLHFIWRLQYFNKEVLCTTQNQKVTILNPGTLNKDGGPDFLNARIKIDELEWHGNVEIHIASSDWNLHHHNHDGAYNNVILHVVWQDNDPVRRDNDSIIPAIELKSRISSELIFKYNSLANSSNKIACAGQLKNVSAINKISMLEKAAVERLNKKSLFIHSLYEKNFGDWQETLYCLLAKNFGFSLNSEPFLRLAENLPYKILLKHRKNILQLESLLFGLSGLLDEKFTDEYPKILFKEYLFLSKKYSLKDNALNRSEWKFLRIRPANFPTIRIAEFSCMIHFFQNLFCSMTQYESIDEIKKDFKSLSVSEYWINHFGFDKQTSEGKSKGLGDESINNIIINTIIPFLFAYGKWRREEIYVERALNFLENTGKENNSILKILTSAGFKMENAYQTQGGIELYSNYCQKKNCLSCEIGVKIMK